VRSEEVELSALSSRLEVVQDTIQSIQNDKKIKPETASNDQQKEDEDGGGGGEKEEEDVDEEEKCKKEMREINQTISKIHSDQSSRRIVGYGYNCPIYGVFCPYKDYPYLYVEARNELKMADFLQGFLFD